jgi:catechol 2,3-dioxygenase-like lactoylglutathione lyase family enzyme
MLGRFLELGVRTAEIGESYEFYQTLGFRNVPTGDIRTHAYAVVDAGDFCIGLHALDPDDAKLVFVRSKLENYARALRRLNICFEYSRLSKDEFNELGFSDPEGVRVELVEAQTFSQGERGEDQRATCGRFLEYSTTTRALDDSVAFWSALGFEAIASGEEPHRWRRMSGAGLVIGLHESAWFESGPSFHAQDIDARLEFLAAKGVEILDRPRDTGASGARAKLVAPDGLPLYFYREDKGPA